MYLKNVMNIYILHVCTFIFSCNYSWHCSCMYQMFICLYWNYNVKIIAFIGKKSEIKKNDQTKKKKKNLERQDLCEIRIINTCTGTRKSLKTTIGCQYKLKDICIIHVYCIIIYHYYYVFD